MSRCKRQYVLNNHAKDRKRRTLDVGGLGAHESGHGFDGRGVGLSVLQRREDARFYEFRNLHRVARRVARACSTLVINALILFLLSPPFTAGAR